MGPIVCHHHFFGSVPPLSGAADPGQIYSAMVRRQPWCLDDMHAVFSIDAVCRIHVHLRAFQMVYASITDRDSRFFANRLDVYFAYCAQRGMETDSK
jgi:hypothetical protein